MATCHKVAAVLLLTSAVMATTGPESWEDLDPLSDEFINLINSKQNSWKAGRNFPEGTSIEYIKRRLRTQKDDQLESRPFRKFDLNMDPPFPLHFDARDQWPECPSIGEIRDQGPCASSWAVAPVEAMTDRFCILTNGTQSFQFSAQDLLSCGKQMGCNGGSPRAAFEYLMLVGIVSEGCRPYEIGSNRTDPTPECIKKCVAGYNVEYKKDMHRAWGWQWGLGEDSVKAILTTSGPVVSTITVFDDFLSYKSGVYEHRPDPNERFYGFQDVKIIGWGIDDETELPYWLIANSWSTNWGDNGFAKIVRGRDDCGIDTSMTTGYPLILQ